MISTGLLAAAFGGAALAANPCAPKNPCAAKAANPCAAKNPCAAGMKVDPKQVTRPAGYKPYKGNKAALIAEGERLSRDVKLSTNGASCSTCHEGNKAFQASFAKPYPHPVQMATDIGMKKINLDEMVQLCMVTPMAAKPLAWDSKELASYGLLNGSDS